MNDQPELKSPSQIKNELKTDNHSMTSWEKLLNNLNKITDSRRRKMHGQCLVTGYVDEKIKKHVLVTAKQVKDIVVSRDDNKISKAKIYGW